MRVSSVRVLGILSAFVVAVHAQVPPSLKTFGTGISQGVIDDTERSLFSYTLSPGSTHGVASHFWITGSSPNVDYSIISYYLDGETTPSIQFQPILACGTFYNVSAGVPWSTAYISKESMSGGWSMRIRIPFQRSLNVTYRSGTGTKDVIYAIVRGTENLPITVGGLTLPTTAKLQLQTNAVSMKPLDFITIGSAPRGTRGAFFMFTLAFSAPNLNTLEGCPHLYTGDQQWPGMILATGTEDLFNSAYYFNAGPYHGDEAGLTHINPSDGNVTLSAYRIYDRDPIFFDDGFRYDWRNGDVTDPSTGLKCTSLTGSTVGSPGVAQVKTYGWSYYW